MPKHSSHNWNESGRCNACDAHVLAFEANYRCIPVKTVVCDGPPLDDGGIFGAWLCDGPPLDDGGIDWWNSVPVD